MFNDDNTAHTQAVSRFTPRGPSFILTDSIKLPSLFCYTPPCINPLLPPNEENRIEMKLKSCACVCVCVSA